MARCPFAVWRGAPNETPSGMRAPILGLILHVIVGTLEAADAVFQNRANKASAHFGVAKDGRLWQWVDTHDEAWAEVAGNPDYWSVETEGQPSEALTEAQCLKVAELYNWLRSLQPIPYAIANSPGERGFGIHSMGGEAWGGHACPGPIRASQRQHILDLAQGSPSQPQAEDPDMPYVVKCQDPNHSLAQYLVVGPHVIAIRNQAELAQVLDDGIKTYAFPSFVFDDIVKHVGA